MKIIKELLIILTCCLAGETAAVLLPFFFPANLLGMFFLLAFLIFRLVKEKDIQVTSKFLLENMQFFLLPAFLGLVEATGRFGGELIKILVITVITTAVTFLSAAFAIKLTFYLMRKCKGVGENL